MIAAITLENFQSHKETHIEFTKGLNVISGPSDSGKSSIIRALTWVIKNRPSGDNIRNWSCNKNDAVRVVIDMGNEYVRKERRGAKSSYITSKSETALEAIGKDVPAEVSDLLNMADVNIQSQHDSYFLLTSSAGNVAKTLNDLVGLSVIDSAFKYLNSDIAVLKREITSTDQSISDIDSEIDKLSHLDELYAEIEQAENTEKEYNELKAKMDGIQSCVDSIRNYESELQSNREWLKIEKPVSEISDLMQEIKDREKNIQGLRELLNSIASCRENIDSSKEQIIHLTSKLTAALKEMKICPTCLRVLDDKTIKRMTE